MNQNVRETGCNLFIIILYRVGLTRESPKSIKFNSKNTIGNKFGNGT